jgi:RNA-directed DNA polymerase
MLDRLPVRCVKAAQTLASIFASELSAHRDGERLALVAAQQLNIPQSVIHSLALSAVNYFEPLVKSETPPVVLASEVLSFFDAVEADDVLLQLPYPKPAYAVPPLKSLGDLAMLLEVPASQLATYLRVFRRDPHTNDMHRHYYTYWQPKVNGGARLIEQPKTELRLIQRRLLRRVFNHIPLHEACHGFHRARSIVTNAQVHVGQPLLLSIDLQEFFLTVSVPKIHKALRLMGYNKRLASAICALTSTRADRVTLKAGREVHASELALQQATTRHLPQGAPSSPVLANVAAFGLDKRLHALAKAAQLNYTRYADDLTFSGKSGAGGLSHRFYLKACSIILEEGYQVNWRKTKWSGAAARQEVTGVVVNQKVNCIRTEFDLLKAVIHSIGRDGVDAANRSGHPSFLEHVRGRIAHVAQLNAAKAAKLSNALISALSQQNV